MEKSMISKLQDSNLYLAVIIIAVLIACFFLSPLLAFFAAFLAKLGLVICSVALGVFGALLGIFSALGGILLAATSIVWALIGTFMVALVELLLVIAIPALLVYWIYTAFTEKER